jgi:choline-sulfatase
MSFFEGSARVPLVINAPDRFKPVRVAEPVSLVDFLPTMLDLAGLSETESVDELAGESVLPLCDGTEAPSPRTVIGEYLGEGAVAPIVMIRRGSWKFVHSPVDPDQLYDLRADPHELANLAADAAHAAAVAEFRAEVAQRWDLEALHQQVLTDQARRRLVTTALRSGRFTSWDYTPPRDDTGEYMRNHLDLYDVERRARWPR